MSDEWVKIGHCGVDSGQLMICDPCYIDSEWKKSIERAAPLYEHKDGTLWYCMCHGGGSEGAMPFGNFEEVIEKYGKTANEMVADGNMSRHPNKKASGEFSYNGVCDATDNNVIQGGMLSFLNGVDGAGVVFRSGFGDGCYDVYARYAEFPDWGRRVVEVKIVLIDETEDEDSDDKE